jgi:hypothetical protein
MIKNIVIVAIVMLLLLSLWALKYNINEIVEYKKWITSHSQKCSCI